MKTILQVNDMHTKNGITRTLLINDNLTSVEELNKNASTANRGGFGSVRQDTMKLECTFIVSPDANYINCNFARPCV